MRSVTAGRRAAFQIGTRDSMTSKLRQGARIALVLTIIGAAVFRPAASTNLTFDGGRLVDSGSREIGIAAGDFNEDGYPDVFTSNSNGTADLLLNRTDNWFNMASGFPRSSTGDNQKVVVGDFDNDNHLDAALVSHSNGLIRVFRGDGAGGILSSLPYSAGASAQPFDIATADVNHDGYLDLVTANQANTVPVTAPTVTVRLNTGSGGFAGGGTYTVGATGALARGVALGDVTGDNEVDIVVVNTNAEQVRILTGDGNGAFALSPTTYATARGPRKVVLADFDEDGDLDIATADSGDGVPSNPANRDDRTTVLLNDGTGVFTAAPGSPFTTGPPASSPFALAAHDLDGDGHLDLAFVHRYGGFLSVLRGAGDGTFGAYQSVPYPDDYTDAEATDIAVADVNHDGKPDLIANAAGSPGYLVPFLNTTTIDPPVPGGTAPASPSNMTSPRLFGTADGATVAIYETNDCSGTPVATGTAAQFASPGIQVPLTGDGERTFYATTTNAAGWATSSCSSTSASYTLDTVPPDAPTIDSTSPASPSVDTTPELIGTAEAGSIVRIYASLTCGGTDIASGTAAVFASPGLTAAVAYPSTTTFTATATDAAGNISACSAPITYSACTVNPIVTTLSDAVTDAPNRLRDAVQNACAGSTITFSTPGLLALANGHIPITSAVTIDGANAVIVRGTATEPVFVVSAPANAALTGLTIMRGRGNTGGGVSVTGGSLSINNSWIRDNQGFQGGGLGMTGGNVVVNGSTISGNTAARGGGIDWQGGTGTGTLLIINSTISGNTASQEGGGIFSFGPGTALVNTTVANNHADGDLGAGETGGIKSAAIYNVWLRNTIVAGNTGPGGIATDVNGLFGFSSPSNRSTFNLIGAGANVIGITNGTFGNQMGTTASPIDARIAPLLDLGGPTPVHGLLSGSPAIDAAAPNGFTGGIDQRGVPRPLDGPDADATQTEDIGAVEQVPSIEDIANRTILEDSAPAASPLQITFNLGDAAAGDLPGDFESITATSDNQALVTDANLTITGTGSMRTLSIVTEPNASGSAAINVLVRKDLNGTAYYATDVFTLTVTGVNDAPTLDPIGTVTVTEDVGGQAIGLSGITAGPLDSNITSVSAISSDPGVVQVLSVMQTGGGTGVLSFTTQPDKFGTVTVTVTVTDDGGTDDGGVNTFSRTFDIVVTPIPDTPQVTPASAFVNTPTTSGLVITPSAVDGPEIQAFRIVNIANGTLTLAGTSTAVGEGAFLSLAQGLGGLSFTPLLNSTATGSFDVIAKIDEADAAVSPPATVTIAVSKYSTTTSVSTSPNPSESSGPVAVLFTVASANGGPTPAGTVDIAISGSSETCSGALTGGSGSCQFTLADAGVNRVVTATYAGDFASSGSSGTTLHTVGLCPRNPVVVNADDSGPGSLRQAIADACSTDGITFDIPGDGPHTITLLGSPLDLSKNLTLTGPAAESVTIRTDASMRLASVGAGATVTIENLTFKDGDSPSGGGAILSSGNLTIRNSTLSGNHAAQNGGAIEAFDGFLKIYNSTLSGNTVSGYGSAIWSLGAVTLLNTTVTANSGLDTIFWANLLTPINSIIAGNTGENLSTSSSGGIAGFFTGHNLYDGDPKLGPLQDNGGPTFTHALLANSPALDAGDDAPAAALSMTTDQRGVARAFDGPDADTTATIDIGAYEARASVSVPNPVTLYEDGPGGTFTVNLGSAVTLATATTDVGPVLAPFPDYLSLTGSGGTRDLFVKPASVNGFGTQVIDIAVHVGSDETLHAPLTVNVLPVADTPTIADAQTAEDIQTTSGLEVSRSIFDGSEVTHFKVLSVAGGTLYKNDGVTPIAAGSFVLFSDGAAGLRFTPAPDSNVTGQITLRASTSASDEGLGGDPITASVFIGPVADAPQVTNVTTLEDTQSGPITILPSAADAASLPSVFKITNIIGGTLTFAGGEIHNGDFISIAQGADGVRFTPSPNSNTAGHFTVFAAYSTSVPGFIGPVGTTATIAITPVADQPSATPASTYVNKQTTSGLVIQRHVADGAEVTHFKITAVTNGTLFQNDGTTSIADGAFITVAQGSAGLTFTPSSGFIGTGSFQAQAALDAAGTGISPAATVSITVDKHLTQTTITAHTPNPVDRNASLDVTYSVVSTTGGPTPTGTVTVTIGTKSCTGTVAAGRCRLSPNTGGAGQTLTATYNGDAVSQGSTTSVLQDVNACPAPLVTTTADSGPGSLRQAIAGACSPQTILFDIPGAGPHTIVLTSGPLVVNKVIWFFGPLDARVRISGNHASRVFDVTGAGAIFTGLEIVDGAADDGAGIRTTGGITLDGVTLSGNVASVRGGAVMATAAAPYVEIFGSTLSGNRAPSGSAVWTDGQTAFVNATVTANTGGGAVVNSHPGSTTANSIVAGNDGPQITNTGAGSVFNVGNSILAGDPKLGPLQDNGGPTFTHMPLPGSPAIDGGDNNLIIPGGSDQRGFERIFDGPDADATATVDIGAVEVVPSIELLGPVVLAEDTASTSITFRLGPSAQTFDSIVATSSNTTLVPNASLVITGSGDTRTLTIAPAANRNGTATITVAATATLLNTITSVSTPLTSTSSFTLTVTPVGDAPAVTSPTTAEDTQTTVAVTPNALDGAETTHFRVSGITNGGVFKSDGVTTVTGGAYVTKAEAAGLKFTPAANLFSPATTFGFTVQAATGVGLASGATTAATITVTPVADTPSVTNASTPVNQQTASGLVIAKSAADGAEVTHYRITTITGGALFQNNGTTPIASGAFITVAQGAAGLKFTPATDSSTTGHFSVQASIGSTAGGLGGGIVTADITVTRLASTTTVVTSSSTVNPGESVTFTATVTPPGAGAAGTVQFMDTATPLGPPVTLSSGTAAVTTTLLAGGLHVISAVYSGNATYQSSTGTLAGGQIVRTPVTLTPVSSANPSQPGQSVSIQVTAAPSSGGGTPSGSVVVKEGSSTLATLTLASGAATYTTSAFTVGTHHLAIEYAGDAAFAPGSTTFDQVVAASRAILTGADAGAAPHVRRFTAIGGGAPTDGALTSFYPFSTLFNGGVRVAEGDVNGDGVPDPIAAPGQGAAPEVRIYDGATGALLRGFLAFEPGFTGGVFVAAGDVNGDGYADVIAGSGTGRRGEVKVFSGFDNTMLRDVLVFAPTFLGGVRVAAGDVNGDGFADLVASTGPGAPSTVTVLNGSDSSVLRSFAPYGGFTGGVFVAAGDVDGDGFADLITGADAGGGPHVQVFNGTTGAVVQSFFAFASSFTGGVRVAAGDVNGDGKAEIIAGAGPGGLAEVRVFDGATAAQLSALLVYPPSFAGGMFVATSVPQHRMVIERVSAGGGGGGSAAGADRRPNMVTGWAYAENLRDAGISAIHVYAQPVSGGAPIFLGVATTGDARADVAARYGSQYANAGFHLAFGSSVLPQGTYDLVVFAQSAKTGTFQIGRTVRFTSVR